MSIENHKYIAARAIIVDENNKVLLGRRGRELVLINMLLLVENRIKEKPLSSRLSESRGGSWFKIY